jgi:Arc/MetJ family transcription regulator
LRTNVVLDDKLVEEAMRFTDLTTKRAVIEEALRLLVRLKSQEEVRNLRGQLHWEGDLETMRRNLPEVGSSLVDR